MAQLHVEVRARERRAVGVDARTVDVLLHQDLGGEVGDLRSHHRDRVPGAAVRGADEQRVRHRAREGEEAGTGVAPRPLRVGGRVRHRAPDHGIDELHRARVRQRDRLERLLGRLRERLVRERRAVNRRGGFGIVGCVDAVEGGVAGGVAAPWRTARARQLRRTWHVRALGTELARQILVQDRVVQLVAAAVAEDATDERRDRHDVFEREWLRSLRHQQRAVLGWHQQRVLLGRGDIRVDAGDVVGRVAVDLSGVDRVRQPVVDLVDEILLRVGLAGPDALVHADVCAARKLRERPLTGVAQRIDEEQPVFGGRPPDSEHQRGACIAVDVRHPELLVAHDRHAWLGALAARDLPALHAERGVLEEVANLRGGDVGRRGREVGVHRQLVVVVRRPLVCGLPLDQLRGVDESVGPRRQDVAKASEVIRPVGLRLAERDRRGTGSRAAREHDRQDRPSPEAP